MKNLEQNINLFEKELKTALESADSQEKLEKVRIDFLGRHGKVVELMSQLKKLDTEGKRVCGPKLNQLKKESEAAYQEKKKQLQAQERELEILKKEQFDVTAYKPTTLKGSTHIISQIVEQIEDIFISMGYKVADGPELETDFYNFEALNIPGDHPARDSHDTFWLDIPGLLMRTQTSTIQIHEMQKHGAPIAVVGSGRVYRNEATDATHEFMFRQIEGLFVGKDVSMGNLLATMKLFLQKLFDKEDLAIRVRPGFFPFVEPGIEIDASCPFCKDGCSVCKKTKWIELVGAGLVHPNVLQHCKIDPKEYSGFAFGFGIERLAMIKYGINDVRLFQSNTIDFLRQF
ncbi:phenylalanine--tRNA ligase subunit alpha [Candidatus Dependentiae bacterium]